MRWSFGAVTQLYVRDFYRLARLDRELALEQRLPVRIGVKPSLMALPRRKRETLKGVSS